MYIYYERTKKDPQRSSATAFSIDAEGLSGTSTQISSFDGRYAVKVENGVERLRDIMEALASETVPVYYITEEIGYWKAPAKKTRKTTQKKQEEVKQEEATE